MTWKSVFWRLLQSLALLAFLLSLSAGTYLFWVGGLESYMCRSARAAHDLAPVLPIPIGFCGVTHPYDPRNLPPPEMPPSIEESVYFKRTSTYGEFPYKETIVIGPGCSFTPNNERYKGHTHLTFENHDSQPHTIVAERNPETPVAFSDFASGSIPPGGKFKMFINQVGVFRYHCQDRPEAKGQFEVYRW